jgi:hypothetical protein
MSIWWDGCARSILEVDHRSGTACGEGSSPGPRGRGPSWARIESIMDAIGRPTTERSSTRRWVAAALSVLLLMLATSAALAQEETEPIQPPEPAEAVGEVSCEPRTPVAGNTLTCTATGAEGFAELKVRFLLYSPARGPEDEGVILQDEEGVVLVEDGVATFAFVIDDWATEGDRWEAYAWMLGGSRQDCFVIERYPGGEGGEPGRDLGRPPRVVATGALESADEEAFVVGGETFIEDGQFYVVCTDEILFDAFDIGLIRAAPEPDEQPVPPDEQPEPPATEPDVATESPVSETEATGDPEPDDAPPLAATGAALLLMLLTGALAVGGGLTMLRR